MEIRVLKYFLTVAREENITKAAEILHITQPTLSRQLTQLEEELGVTLFHRGSRKISLTNEGILLRRRASEIIELVDKAEHEILESEDKIEGKISFACGEITAVQILVDVIKAFQKKYPLVTYELLTIAADGARDNIDRGLIDIGLLLEPVSIDKYDFIRLGTTERYITIMRTDDPLVKQEAIKPKDLVDKPIILPIRESVLGEIASWFGDYYKDINVILRSNMSTNASIFAEKGLGYPITIEGSQPYLDSNKMVMRRLEPDLLATTVLAWKRHQPYGIATNKFIEFAKEYFKQK